jgi:pSer/pThr/pTyr-binding forkhead associated (FHA) protein
MSFLVIAQERYTLRDGDNTLGGQAPGAVKAPQLMALPAAAVIRIAKGEAAVIWATTDTIPVRVEGYVVGADPQQLRHGARIEVGECALRYGELSLVDSTAPVKAVEDESLPSIFPVVPSVESPQQGAHLVDLDRGTVYRIPTGGLLLGRDPVCQVVLASTAVSRQHALIARSNVGYTVTDRSTNGLTVNAVKVQGSQQLFSGDVVRVADYEFRFETVSAAVEAAPPPAMATLEVIEGALKGMIFRISQTVTHIGRGPDSDIKLEHETVSTTHASLLRRGALWHLVDHGSTNGTYLEGERIATERVIRGDAHVSFGAIRLLFRPAA